MTTRDGRSIGKSAGLVSKKTFRVFYLGLAHLDFSLLMYWNVPFVFDVSRSEGDGDGDGDGDSEIHSIVLAGLDVCMVIEFVRID